MSHSEYTDKERPSAHFPIWRAGIITIYDAAPRRGQKPKRVAFPCTKENQLIFQRLEQEQGLPRGSRERKKMDAARLAQDFRKPSP